MVPFNMQEREKGMILFEVILSLKWLRYFGRKIKETMGDKRMKIRGNLQVGYTLEMLLKAKEGIWFNGKEGRPGLKGAQTEVWSTCWRWRGRNRGHSAKTESRGRSKRENPEESATTLRRAGPEGMTAVDRPSGNAVDDLLRRVRW